MFKSLRSGGELVFPKTYQGRKITVIGGSSYLSDISYGKNDPITLVLNKNITEIKKGTFARPNAWIEKITGDTSSLRTIGDYAFMGKGEGQSIDITLEYNGKVTIGSQIFRRVPNVRVHLSHKTTLSNTSFGASKVTYDFIDDHIYGEPVWNWDLDDYAGANVTRTCTSPYCDYSESCLSEFFETKDEYGNEVRAAMVEFDDMVYYDVPPVYRTEVGKYIVEVTGRYKGQIFAGKHNLVSKEGFRVVFKDKNGNRVDAPQYIWVAQESPSDGIALDPNGDVALTEEGEFHVQLRSTDEKTIYSPWITIRSFWGSNDEFYDSDDETSSLVSTSDNDISKTVDTTHPDNEIPKTGDTAPATVATILITSLLTALFFFGKSRKNNKE